MRKGLADRWREAEPLRALLRLLRLGRRMKPSALASVAAQRGTLLGVAAITAGAALLVIAADAKHREDQQAALRNFRDHSHYEASVAANSVREKLRLIHQGLRTISYLPSVRAIDRHGANIDNNARESIQHLYNNLRGSVEISEVYIVPVDFNPERFDPTTGALEAPTLMFDQLIVDAASLAREGRSSRSFEEAFANGVDEAEEVDEIEEERETAEQEEAEEDEEAEIEVFEYRVLRDQLDWLAAHAPDVSTLGGFERPMLSTPEVITCDNTVYAHSHRDADRSGTIFSVPFFGVDGRLRGVVAAIVRTGALSAYLPGDHYALINAGQNFQALRPSAELAGSLNWIARAEADPALLYSETIPVSDFDPRGNWMLWVGAPNEAFQHSADLLAANDFHNKAIWVIALLAIVAAAALMFARVHLNMLKTHQRRMHEVAEERSKRIEDLTRAQAETAASKARAMHIAYHDVVTGLPNRAYLSERLARAAEQLRRSGAPFSVLCIDLDRFKEVNDTFGHAAGDELIRHAALRLASACRRGDTLARLGGDEFSVIQVGASPAQTFALAERFVALMAEPFDLPMGRMHIGCSVGATIVSDAQVDGGEALRQADLALYRAKGLGRGCAALFEIEMDAAVRTRRVMQVRLREAMAADRLDVVYQPQVDGGGRVTGVEALVRWFEEGGGAIPPSLFVSIAEECGLIGALGEYVMRRAFQDARAWPGIKTAINVSAPQIRLRGFVESVAALAGECGIDPRDFELEITEGILLGDDPQVHDTLMRLRGLGFALALDDFGTGYSSLSYLQRYPIDKIKIDRSFVVNLGEDREADAVIEAIVQLARALSLRVIAEGVETGEQRSRLLRVGCGDVQGFYFGKPMARERISEMLARRVA